MPFDLTKLKIQYHYFAYKNNALWYIILDMGAFGPLGWAACLAVLTVVHGGANVPCDNTGKTIYDYSFTDLYGTKEIPLSDYKGKVRFTNT